MRRRFGKNDLLLIGGLVLVCILAFLLFGVAERKTGTKVVITRDGQEIGSYSLSEDRRISIPDSDGKITNVLKIQDGKAKMIQADCRDHLCMHQKAISAKNENIVCLPNRIVATVEDDSSGGYDGFAQ